MIQRLRRSAQSALLVAIALVVASNAAARAQGTITPICATADQTSPCETAWYTSAVTVSWRVAPTPQRDENCGSETTFAQDARSSVSCAAWWSDGTSAAYSMPINVEVSAPTVTAAPDRSPDFSGWYNHPVAAAVQGTAFSGIQSCTGTTYAGPDTSGATVSGSCTDNAGKVVTVTSAPFPYDATPPTLNIATAPGDRLVVFRWPVSPDLTLLTIERTPGVRGSSHSVLHRGDSGVYRDARVRNGIRYQYTITLRDEAGNTAAETVVVRPGPRLLGPAPNATVGTPLLSWTPVRGADYYNVQLFRGGKILSAWPSHAFLQLRGAWRFSGRHYRLRRGRYRWYVWPGFGRRPAARYGRLIGSRSFIVP